MTESKPAYTVWANLRWFSVVYLLGSFAAVLLVTVAEDSFGLSLEGANFALQLGMFAAVAVEASRRFLARSNNNWTRADRRLLAVGYAASSIVLPTVLGISMSAATLEGRAELGSIFRAPWIFLGALLLAGLIAFGLAHLILHFVDRGRTRDP